jgi:ATP-dependent helicase/nuclease subunit A
MFNPELILVKTDEQDNAENDVAYQEAYSTAEYIKKIMSPDSDFKVMHDGKLEKPHYSDIAILLRSTRNVIDKYTTILSDEGIPVNANVGQGFFGTGEVKTIINFLKCLVNPRQDIPFAALLLSPLVGATNEELGELVSKKGFLYDDICNAMENGQKVPSHIRQFIGKYRCLKTRAGILPVTELLDEIYDVTGFYRLMLGFPKGARRAANLEFFREQAVTFEKTGNAGLYSFVGYLENCEDKEVDFGEASDENTGDSVSVMTIHHSKGLEYPVVIIPQLFKKMNDSDIKSKLVIHPVFGAALPYVDYERRTKDATLSRNYLAELLKTETIAEELRVLYVAVTRAREKLVLLGAANDLAKVLPEATETDIIDYSELLSSKNYFDFVKGAVFRETAVTERFREFAKALSEAYKEPAKGMFHTFLPLSEKVTLRSKTTGNIVKWDVSIVPGHGKPINALIKSEKTEEALAFAKDVLSGRAGRESADTGKAENLRKAADFMYPFAEFTGRAVKHSVSELKYEQLQRTDLDTEDDYDRGVKAGWLTEDSAEQKTAKVPADQKTAKAPAGKKTAKDYARRGTATHRIMELLPFEKPMDFGEVENFVSDAVKKGLIPEDDAKLVSLNDIAEFTSSPVYTRMCTARSKGMLFREQPFTTGDTVQGGDDDDISLVQGVIDAYFVEEDGAVLIDYKTDNAPEDALRNRYERQLDIYAGAIGRIRGLKVKEKLIYSFRNRSFIPL